MRLTTHTDYALRLLMLLALEPDRLHTIEEVATRYRVSRNHLMKVVLTLVGAGLVESLRGRGGGLQLAKPAAAISVGEVVRATEDSFALVECFERESNTCMVSPCCTLKGALHEAMAAFLRVLDQRSLAQLCESPARNKRFRDLLAEIPVVVEPVKPARGRRRSAAPPA
ncbi:transcriptional regulator, BadM/Rrf2 family [Solimonas aquatica]|uniref:Transcriptional regulator, BadM/Rrf2 family n=1 Tax=Solimonas aquatica TaxID=489703 RepID=A0A1H9A4X8_9GAMM|nr:Rrf2 family transcriptional regulator [Solimonas aquatica]SEP71553.1 transcriptional regulator, BadM/Rrf2 family [Solimonas aquatica]